LLAEPIAYPMQRSDGRCSVEFKRRAGGTVLGRLHQSGCCKARFSAPNEAILINTAGGMTSGDHVTWTASIDDYARAVVTTQACERIYRSFGDGPSIVETSLTIKDRAALFWLPQETILFDDSDFSRTLEVDMAETAEFLCVDAVVFGRRAMGESLKQARFLDRWRIRRGGRLVHADALCFEGGIAAMLERPAVARGAAAMATILLVAEHCDVKLDAVRACLGEQGAASAFNGKLLARIVADDSYALRKILSPALECLMGDRPLPRVWAI
jgi:urease accessory protein